MLGELQDFDPPGVMARSLAECLTLQLKEMGRFDPLWNGCWQISISSRARIFPRCYKVCERR